MSVDCFGAVEACTECAGALGECLEEGLEVEERGVVEIIELALKHESALRRLIKALKRCCLHSGSSSDEEIAKAVEKQGK
jgi:hypothetical protein